jgi:hypothetical protein
MQVASADGAQLRMGVLARDRHCEVHLNGRQEFFSQTSDGMSSSAAWCRGETHFERVVSERSK